MKQAIKRQVAAGDREASSVVTARLELAPGSSLRQAQARLQCVKPFRWVLKVIFWAESGDGKAAERWVSV